MRSIRFLGLRLSFSFLCFCCSQSILFCCFNGLFMLPLLYLIFCNSPYSEHLIAGSYFCVYLQFTELTLILILLYLPYVNGSIFFNLWAFNSQCNFIYAAFAIIVFTKVPLIPLHTWLAIVHIEATSTFSIILSFLIMQLSSFCIYRCTLVVFSGSFVSYLYLFCLFSIFFLIPASGKLDGKRWLDFSKIASYFNALFSVFCSWLIEYNFILFIVRECTNSINSFLGLTLLFPIPSLYSFGVYDWICCCW